MSMREDCDFIVHEAISGVRPDAAVEKALRGKVFPNGQIVIVSIGKAAWTMARTAKQILGVRCMQGIVITKYGHSQGGIEDLLIYEAGHPIPDENSLQAAEAALRLTENLAEKDTVVFLISGGGSSLFEAPLITLDELQNITQQLLSCGADIVEMNTIRKRLSKVKGGRFAEHCSPASVFAIVLSDIIGDPLDMIASGPAYPDGSTSEQALSIAEKYGLTLTPDIWKLLRCETPSSLERVETIITGSVRELCACAAEAARTLGYDPVILTDSLNTQAREAGSFLASIARYHQNAVKSLAFIAGGETVVQLTGKGKGGRNQELALSAATGVKGLQDTAVFSFGSDGTDGPTDAAGGFVDGNTYNELAKQSISIYDTLQNNDAYHALLACGGLIITGPTGTNVNDAAVLLVKR